VGEVVSCEKVQFGSIDDCLGPSRQRFFGGGFKRVLHDVRDVGISADDDGRGVLRARASLSYPADWSTKANDTSLRPHLSTVDALLLAIQLTEVYLTHAGDFELEQRRRMWLRSFTMRAGATPTENLGDFPIEAMHVDREPAPFTLCGEISTFACVIGAIKVRCTIEHEPVRTLRLGGGYSSVDEVLGCETRRYYGTGYKQRDQLMRAVEFDPDRRQVEALVSVVGPTGSDLPDLGFGGEYQPSVSPLESLTVLAQLSQVLLYETDRLTRDETKTMWMRSVTMESLTPYHSVKYPSVAGVKATNVKTLNLGGGVWRAFDVDAQFQGFRFTSALAHELPAGVISLV